MKSTKALVVLASLLTLTLLPSTAQRHAPSRGGGGSPSRSVSAPSRSASPSRSSSSFSSPSRSSAPSRSAAPSRSYSSTPSRSSAMPSRATAAPSRSFSSPSSPRSGAPAASRSSAAPSRSVTAPSRGVAAPSRSVAAPARAAAPSRAAAPVSKAAPAALPGGPSRMAPVGGGAARPGHYARPGHPGPMPPSHRPIHPAPYFHHPWHGHMVHCHPLFWDPIPPRPWYWPGFWHYCNSYWYDYHVTDVVVVRDYVKETYKVDIVTYGISGDIMYAIVKDNGDTYLQVYDKDDHLLAEQKINKRYCNMVIDSDNGGCWISKKDEKDPLLFIWSEGKLLIYEAD